MFGLGFIVGLFAACITIVAWTLFVSGTDTDDQNNTDDTELMEQIHKQSALDGQEDFD